MPRKQKQSSRGGAPPWAMEAQPQLMTLYDASGRPLLVSLHGGAPLSGGVKVGKGGRKHRPVGIPALEEALEKAVSREPSRGRSHRGSSVGSARSGRSRASVARLLEALVQKQPQPQQRPCHNLYRKLHRLERAAAQEGKWTEQHTKELAQTKEWLAKLKAEHAAREGRFHYARAGAWPAALEPDALSQSAEALKAARSTINGVLAAAAQDAQREKRHLGAVKRLAQFNGMTAEELKAHRHFLPLLDVLLSKPLRLRRTGDFQLVARALIERHKLYEPGILAEQVLEKMRAKAEQIFAPAGGEFAIDAAALLATPGAAKAVNKALERIARKRVVEQERLDKSGMRAALAPPAQAAAVVAPAPAVARSPLFSMRY